MKKIYLSLLTVLMGAGISAQTTYLEAGPTAGQGPLLNSESTTVNTNWTEIHSYNSGAGSSDNSWSAAVAIPFSFDYFGGNVTQFCVSKNGLLTFDASVAGTTLPASVTADNSALPNVDLPDSTIAWFWGGFGNPAPLGTNDDIWMKEFGTAPNRQLWIKTFSLEMEAQGFTYNYVVLEETTNKIYVVDARWDVAGVGSYTVGVQLNGTTAIQNPGSPNIASINGNVTAPFPNVHYYEFTPFIPSNDDALLSSIDAPQLPLCNGMSDVEITIGSLGQDTLFDLDINWSVNGTIQTPFSWSDTLTQTGTESGIIIGNYTFLDGDTLEVWTSNPNGNTDGDTSNDTLSMTVSFGLNGTYLIAASGTGDYLTFNDAITDITNLGVCGSVIFEVETGTYTEQFMLPEIQGMDNINTVTFRSQSGDSTDVNLEFAGTGTGDNYVVQFDGGDFFSFENMSLRNNGTTYGRVLVVGGNSTNNRFQNCILEGNLNASTTSTNLSVVYSTSTAPSNDSDWLFENNRILGGSYGVYWYGQTALPYQETGTVFNNNRFEDNYYRGARLFYQDSATFTNNWAHYDNGYTTGLDVFYFGNCDSVLTVTNNYVYLDSLYGDGITLSNCDGGSQSHAMVNNNQIIVNSPNTSSTQYGLYQSGSDYAQIYNNSIYIDNTGSSSRALYSTGGSNNEVINNAIVNNGSGYGVYYVTSSISVSDYNNIYAPNGNVGYLASAAPVLSTWQLLSTMDSNSVSVDPMFNAIDDLHTCGAGMDNIGMPGLPVTMDIDGEMRSTTLPDIGADEFYAPAALFIGNDTSKCIGQQVTIGFNANTANYLWSDMSTSDSITVTAPGIYHLTISGSCGTAIDSIEITDIPDAVADFNQSTSFLTAILTDQSSGADSWSWDFGDGTGTSTAQNPIYVYSAPGQYIITLTVTGPCGTDMTTQLFDATTVGIDEASFDGAVSTYPNPVNDVLNISFSDWTFGDLQLTVMDLSGKVVRSENISGEGSFVNEVSVSDLAVGTYLLKLSTEDGSQIVRRFVKQ